MFLPVKDMVHSVVCLLGRQDEEEIAGDEIQALAVAHIRESVGELV